jgi:hypothetical protein
VLAKPVVVLGYWLHTCYMHVKGRWPVLIRCHMHFKGRWPVLIRCQTHSESRSSLISKFKLIVSDEAHPKGVLVDCVYIVNLFAHITLVGTFWREPTQHHDLFSRRQGVAPAATRKSMDLGDPSTSTFGGCVLQTAGFPDVSGFPKPRRVIPEGLVASRRAQS